jgi:hypothetical protein
MDNYLFVKQKFKAEGPRAMISTGGKSAQIALPLITQADINLWGDFLRELHRDDVDHSDLFCGTEIALDNFFAVMLVNDGKPLKPAYIADTCKPWRSAVEEGESGELGFKGCIFTVSFLTGGHCSMHNLGGSDGTKDAAIAYFTTHGNAEQRLRWAPDADRANPTSCMTTCASDECKTDLEGFVRQDKRLNVFYQHFRVYLDDIHREGSAIQFVPAGAIDTLYTGDPRDACAKIVKPAEFSFRWMHLFLEVYTGLFASDVSLVARYAGANDEYKLVIKKNSWVVGKAASVGEGYLTLCRLPEHPVKKCTLTLVAVPQLLEELDSELSKLISY